MKRVVVEVARDTAVLNADDDLCLKMADYTRADHLCYVTMNSAHALVKEHIQAGGRAVVLEQGINGDMITMGLLQGVVNTFVIFLSRVVGHVVDRVVFKTERGYGPAYWITTIVAQIFLSILASMIVMWFSRYREYRADEGGAALSSRSKMVQALRALQKAHEPEDMPGQLAAFGISGARGEGFKSLFRSHPPLSERIAALESDRVGSEI